MSSLFQVLSWDNSSVARWGATSPSSMTSSAQLEREAEQARSQLAQAVEELRPRITPGHLMDQVVDYTKDTGSGEFVRNLGK